MSVKYKILNRVTTDMIKEIADEHFIEWKESNYANLVLRTVCHGGDSYKLYFHENRDNKGLPAFYCYTGCGALSVFDFVMSVKNCSYDEAQDYLSDKTGVYSINTKPIYGFFTKRMEIHHDYTAHNIINRIKDDCGFVNLPSYDDNILNEFYNKYYQGWVNENISVEAMEKFNIKYCIHKNQIVIPHEDSDDNVVGIRVRNLNKDVVSRGYKYLPLEYNGKYYSHPIQYNLYGINHNQEYIKEFKKVMLVEAEKSVLQVESFYPDKNFTLGTMGRNFSNHQLRELVYSLGVEEIIIGYDKEYKDDMLPKELKKYKLHMQKIRKVAKRLAPYVEVYLIMDRGNLLDYKDSPTDKGKEVLETLMKHKIRIDNNDEFLSGEELR